MSKRRHTFFGRLLRKSIWFGGFLVLAGFIAFSALAAVVSRDLPDPNTLSTRAVPQSTKIFDRTGAVLLYEIHGDEKRTLVTMENIPDAMKWATVAIEDKKFYEHRGVYWKGLFRAAVMSVLKRQRVQGTSTLTQQLVKNAILTNERSMIRKLKEFILAIQMERAYTKDQILQLYFNEIPYGSTIYGVESAAQSYFGKRAKDLTLDQAALLAAIPQRPDFYSPYGTGRSGDNRDRLVIRQHYILDLMAEQGRIKHEQAEEAKKADTLKKLVPKKMGDIRAPHFVMEVKGQLEEKYGQKTVEQGGLRVLTTLDWKKQEVAEEEVARGVEQRGKKFGFTNAALISLDPKNGQTLAMVGSKDFYDIEHDGQVNVTTRPRQPGSSFKPVVYAVGFQLGYLPETELWDVNTIFKTDVGPYAPHDYDGKERGPVTIRRALQNSLNTPAVKMLYLAGVGRVLDFAEQLGYSTLRDRSRFGLSLVLGGGEVKPLEHASAYAAFANDGVSQPVAMILKVEDARGVTLEEWKPSEGQRVMDPQIARMMSNVLSDTNARTEIFGAQNALALPDRPVAAKTGTTNNFRDAWTAGYTPSIATVVWVGNNQGEMKKGADGSVIAAPIWQAFMKRATRDLPVERFLAPEPSSATKPAVLGRVTRQLIKIDKVSGKRATEFTPPEQTEERAFFEARSILHYVDKNDPLGPSPENPASDPQYENWESAVQGWAIKTQWHSTDTAPLLYDDVHTAENQPRVNILSPAPYQEIASRVFPITAQVSAARQVMRMDASINGASIGQSVGVPWDINARIPGWLRPDSYNLVVTALDDVGNRGSASATINLTAPVENARGFEVLRPLPHASWSRSAFPQTILLDWLESSMFTRVSVAFVGADGSRFLVANESVLNAATQITVPVGPAAGTYTLSIIGTKTDDSQEETSVPIVITD